MTSKEREVMTLALEALQDYVDEYGPWSDDSGAQYVLRVGKEALAQPEQRNASEHLEPVAWWNGNSKFATPKAKDWDKRTGGTTAFGCDIPLYTTPPQQSAIARSSSATPLKPLTDEQIEAIWREGIYSEGLLYEFNLFARAIEAAHGITASEAEDSQQRSKT